jgi:hydrogenase expression/formation protein HypD
MNETDACRQHLLHISELCQKVGKQITIMEICGGHTNVIMKYGIRSMLPKNLRLISGPGCPVCVSSQLDIDRMVALADAGIPIATYGDMLKVPGTDRSLDSARAKSGKVFEVYAATEVLALKEKFDDLVFFGVGFETTAPMSAFLLSKGVCVYSVHKTVPPALDALAKGDVAIDGFINPGHVSTIIGADGYGPLTIPQVIAGFTPERILRAIYLLMEMISRGNTGVLNGYPEAVSKEGNRKALGLLNEHFRVGDSEWRGLGIIPDSGLEIRDNSLNAKIVHDALLSRVPRPQKTACRCGDVLRGMVDPHECPLFGKTCSPCSPVGACMVSAEGSCAISYRYRGAA